MGGRRGGEGGREEEVKVATVLSPAVFLVTQGNSLFGPCIVLPFLRGR